MAKSSLVLVFLICSAVLSVNLYSQQTFGVFVFDQEHLQDILLWFSEGGKPYALELTKAGERATSWGVQRTYWAFSYAATPDRAKDSWILDTGNWEKLVIHRTETPHGSAGKASVYMELVSPDGQITLDPLQLWLSIDGHGRALYSETGSIVNANGWIAVMGTDAASGEKAALLCNVEAGIKVSSLFFYEGDISKKGVQLLQEIMVHYDGERNNVVVVQGKTVHELRTVR